MKKLEICSLVIVCSLFLGAWTLAHAMGGSPPEKEKPKYKLEILKMHMITAPGPSVESENHPN